MYWFHILYAIRICSIHHLSMYNAIQWNLWDVRVECTAKTWDFWLQTVNLSHHCHPMWYKMFLKSHIIDELNVVCLYRENNSINCWLLTTRTAEWDVRIIFGARFVWTRLWNIRNLILERMLCSRGHVVVDHKIVHPLHHFLDYFKQFHISLFHKIQFSSELWALGGLCIHRT